VSRNLAPPPAPAELIIVKLYEEAFAAFVRLGYFKPWFSLYDSQSSNDFLLMERPSIVEIARNVAAGDARAHRTKFLCHGGRAEVISRPWLLRAPPTGRKTSSLLNGEQLGMVGRLAGRPYYDDT